MLEWTVGMSDATDALILSHCQAHFGGSLSIMHTYYKQGGKGVAQAIPIQRIAAIDAWEKATMQSAAQFCLMPYHQNAIAQAQEAYQLLKEAAQSTQPTLHLLADLILDEETTAADKKEQLFAQKEAIIPLLLKVVKEERYYSDLFPGYGYAPQEAARALGILQAEDAIVPLFDRIGHLPFAMEEVFLAALAAIGSASKDFLLQRVCAQPITQENEKAAAALIHFKAAPEVPLQLLEVLEQPAALQHPVFMSYLVLCCDTLHTKDTRQRLQQLAHHPKIDAMVRQDIKMVCRHW